MSALFCPQLYQCVFSSRGINALAKFSLDLFYKTNFILIYLLLVTAGCVHTPDTEYKSKWVKLDQSRKIKCVDWPLDKKDVRIEDIWHASGKDPGFLVSIVQRSGNLKFYWYPFSDSSRNWLESRKSFPIPEEAVIAGLVQIDNRSRPIYFINKSDKTYLEYLPYPGSETKNLGEFSSDSISGASSVQDRGNLWIYAQHDNDEKHSTSLSHLDVKADPIIKKINQTDFGEIPLLIPTKSSESLYVLKSDLSTIMVSSVSKSKIVGTETAFSLAADQGIENWSAALMSPFLYIAYVDGDSLIGDAKLHILKYKEKYNKFKEINKFDYKIEDTHISKLHLFKNKNKIALLMMQWVDQESTIARFFISEHKVSGPEYLGVFPKGSQISLVFSDEKTEDLFVIVRHKKADFLEYKMCRL